MKLLKPIDREDKITLMYQGHAQDWVVINVCRYDAGCFRFDITLAKEDIGLVGVVFVFFIVSVI